MSSTILGSQNSFHFVGIGGIGMSALAMYLKYLGHVVSGSDKSYGQNVAMLERKGITVSIGHRKENLKTCNVVIYSSAVESNNIEIRVARRRGLKTLHKSEVLREISTYSRSILVCGSHGKTTVTSLISHILTEAGLNPSTLAGGIMLSENSNVRLGDKNLTVIECDESDGKMENAASNILVINNLTNDHIDFYGSVNKLQEWMQGLINKIKHKGNLVINDRLVFMQRPDLLEVTTFGDAAADVTADNVCCDETGSTFDVLITSAKTVKTISSAHIKLLNHHNVMNSLAAISVAQIMGITPEIIKNALNSFQGTYRRFTKIGEIGNSIFIDDYAHHPNEIRYLAEMAKIYSPDKKSILIMQPLRFSRLRNFFDEFVQVLQKFDFVLITDVFPRDKRKLMTLIDSTKLVQTIYRSGFKEVYRVHDQHDIANKLLEINIDDKLVLFIGGGDINVISQQVYNMLKSIY